MNQLDNQTIEGRSTININSFSGLSYTSQGSGIFEYIFIQHENEVITITNGTQDPTNQKFNDVAESILETFQLN